MPLRRTSALSSDFAVPFSKNVGRNATDKRRIELPLVGLEPRQHAVFPALVAVERIFVVAERVSA